MKQKTAKKFLRRNETKIARHNAGHSKMAPSLAKRVKEATRTLVREGD